MRQRFAILLLCTWWAARAIPCSAQVAAATFSGRPISSVHVLIERAPAGDPALEGLIETRPGETLSLAKVRESITHLYSLGRFQDVEVDAVDNGAGVDLRYNLVPLHHVERVNFRGQLGLSEGLLRSTMTERFSATPPVGRAAEVARVLEQVYEDHGYFAAKVQPSATELHDPDRTILNFDVEAGPRAMIRAVVVSGQPRATYAAVVNRLGVAADRPYERAVLQRRLTEYVEDLKKRRYYQAAATHTAQLSEDQRRADLTIDIQSGPLVRVTYVGDPLPADRLEELVPIEREGTADEDLREDSAQRIRNYLHSQGYWKADVSVDENQKADELDVIFTIRKGPVYRVSEVEISGASAIPIAELQPLVPLAVGDVFTAEKLDTALGAIRQLYRSRGFAWVEVKAAVTEVGLSGDGRVRPSIAIVEGPRATVGAVTITGAQQIPEAEIRARLQSKPGVPWYEPTAAADRDAILIDYLNLGYAGVEVTVRPTINADRTRADLQFSIREGPQTRVDHIIIVGNQRTDAEVIREEILLRPGAPLGLQDMIESRRRLSALGLFRRINITELAHGGAERRDVVVTVEEAPATSLGYGGGVELTRRLRQAGPEGQAEERIEWAPRGFFEIGRRNLGGRNRSVNLYTRVSVRPRDAPDDPAQDGRGFGFGEYRVVGTYREPRAFGWNADLTVTGAAEQGVRSSFNFTRKGVTVELLRRLTPAIRSSARYSLGTTKTYDERLTGRDVATIDRLFPQVRLSTISGAVARDTRDDLADPTRGTFLSVEGSVAARSIGGQVGFVKSYIQGYWFTPILGTQRLIFATRAATGLADGFARTVQSVDENGQPIPDQFETIEDLPASERFFAGGDTTIRGFALDSVATPDTISAQGFPKGGNAVLILNAELRVPVWGDLGMAMFMDGGNVFNRVTAFDLGELRGSVGVGVRYRSPIGPVRLDLGFKLDKRENERGSVLHFSIGQAF
jgi:outer membrane protein assembly factor BamA